MPARVAASTGHVLSTDAPANNAKLTNSGARTAGGLENLGTQTTNEFTASGSAEQPASTQSSAKYPTNHVYETESGHYVEFDDTSGNERIHLYHKMGTFIEIDSAGNVIIKTVGNVTNIVAGNMDTYVKGNYSISAGGNIDIYAKKNLTEKVDENVKNTIAGTLTEEVTMDVKQDYKMNLTTTITARGSIKASGAMTVGGSSIRFN